MRFNGTIEISIDESVKGEFLDSHGLDEKDFNDRNKIKGALLNEARMHEYRR